MNVVRHRDQLEQIGKLLNHRCIPTVRIIKKND